jgi:2-polyprenyl-3-methyl-5-hydroxy-6-metoxy-1,4-benzoquinol methylase
MKILVAIAYYGTKNQPYLRRLVAAYRSMPFDVDIVVMTERSKGLGSGVTEQVGLPTRDPWSLPFAHRRLFAENADNYDLFIYSEDDTLILETHVRAFLRAVDALPADRLPGFLRYERRTDGTKHYPDLHGAFHWLPGSVARFGTYVTAEFSNEHAACYLLTRAQLKAAIASGGYSLAPHQGRYDLLCTAATDPYTQCGFRKTICISHLADFELHHLPDVYVNRTGIDERAHRCQIAALFEVLVNARSRSELLGRKPAQGWEKDYHEPACEMFLRSIPAKPKSILSVGCGAGATEVELLRRGHKITAIPLDAVIGSLSARFGVRMLTPELPRALEELGRERFDTIVLAGILHHLPDPSALLRRLDQHLGSDGVLVASVPNLGPLRRRLGKWMGKNAKWSGSLETFAESSLHLTSESLVKQWLRSSGFRLVRPIAYADDGPAHATTLLKRSMPDALVAARMMLTAQRGRHIHATG